MRDVGHRASVEAALNLELGERTPVNNFALVTAARSAGITVDDARWHPKVSARVSIDYSLRTHSDFVKPVLDSQIPFADLGMKVNFPHDDYGFIKEHPVNCNEDVDDLAFFDPNIASECPNFTKVIVEALQETSAMIEEDLHICGLSWGPISTAGYLMGTENMLMETFMDPDMVKRLITKSSVFVAEQQRKMIDSGATVMWMADPTSSEDLISPDMFMEYSHGDIKNVIMDIKGRYDVPSFLHVCGNTLNTMSLVADTGLDCFSFDHAVDIAKAKEKVGGRFALMGNVHPISAILNGTPEIVKRECYGIIEKGGYDGGLILAPGCETPQASPDENVMAMGLSGIEYWKR